MNSNDWYVAEMFGLIVAGPFTKKREAKAWLESYTPGIVGSHRYQPGMYEYMTGYADEEDRDSYLVGTAALFQQDGWDLDDRKDD